jgi:uncharacterized membrane protein YecN with MAPEG domain
MAVHVLPLYAALFALFFVALSVRTLRLRRRLKIAIGDSGDERMLRAIRVHSNFAEYVPFGLFLIFLVELQGAPLWLVHGLCLCLLAGRLSHAFGVSRTNENYRFRVFGMALTFTALLTSAAALLAVYVRHRGT